MYKAYESEIKIHEMSNIFFLSTSENRVRILLKVDGALMIVKGISKHSQNLNS